ncbi:hypothetical protein HDU97_005330 [Phlyctochytrium planicorne]|nr:hypothetical protein HDU97_005330 [Phlyctochytrium planicorne]
MWKPHIAIQPEIRTITFEPVEKMVSYALGFGVLSYRGKKAICHSGATPGYTSKLCTFPSEKVSIIILTNSPSHFSDVASRILFDRVLFRHEESLDWNSEYVAQKKVADDAAKESFQKLMDLKKIGSAIPSLPLSEFYGEYKDVSGGYGILTVVAATVNNTDLVIKTDLELIVNIQHLVNDTFLAFTNDPVFFEPLPINFENIDGRIRQVSISLEPSIAPIVFKRL